MPYLKIKVANNGKSDDWITINSLDLNTLNVNGNATIKGNTTIDGNATIKGNTTIGDSATVDTLTINANVTTFKSTGTNTDKQTQSIEISNGELKIQSPGKDDALSLGTYLNLNTSGCTVGDTNEPGKYEYWGEKKPKEGDLYVQKKEVIQNEKTVIYSLLWYHNGSSAIDGTQWTLINAIWG